jgi:raffinose/stachyose/melibiose transport system permease protein
MKLKIGRATALTTYAVIILVPLTIVIFGTFKSTDELFAHPFAPPQAFSLENYSEVVSAQRLDIALLNSVIVTVTSLLITMTLASLAAYGVSRSHGIVSWLLFGFLVLGMAVPAQTTMIPQYVLFEQLGLLDSLLGLIVANVMIGLPVAVFILAGFMRTLPIELFEASAIDGVGAWRAYRSIALPLSAPSLAAASIFVFVMSWNELLYPLLFIQSPENRTLPLALLSFQGEFQTDYPLLFSGVILASLPVVLIYVLLQRYFVAGMTAGSTKG